MVNAVGYNGYVTYEWQTKPYQNFKEIPSMQMVKYLL